MRITILATCFRSRLRNPASPHCREYGRSRILVFGWSSIVFGKSLPLSSRLNQTAAISKLFVESDDRRALADETVSLFTKAPDPKMLLRERLSYRDMSDEDRKSYESQIVNFFLQNMSPH